MAQTSTDQVASWLDLSTIIDERFTWLKGIASLLASQGETSDISISPEKETIGAIGWLIEHLVEETKVAVDKLYDSARIQEGL